MLSYILHKSHELIRQSVRPGDSVFDATVGNGHDTLFLARLVGPTGRVIGCDIQPSALRSAREMLSSEGVIDRCELQLTSHHQIVTQDRFSAVMFNLGYLPQGDRSVRTTAATTVQALTLASKALIPGGVITIVVYRGHEGGVQEFEAIQTWAAELDQDRFDTVQIEDPGGPPYAPLLIAVEACRLGEADRD